MNKLICLSIIIQIIGLIYNVNSIEINENKKLQDYQLNSNLNNDLNSDLHNGLNNNLHNDLNSDLYNVNLNNSNFINLQREFLEKDLIKLILDSNFNSLSNQCSKSLNEFKLNLINGSAYASKMYDSSSKQISNLLDGTFLNLGDFDQCLNLKLNEHSQYIGKYFLLNLVPFNLKYQNNIGITPNEFRESNFDLERRLAFVFKFPDLINVKLGICLPNHCNDNEIQLLVNQTINKFNWKIHKQINSQINNNLWSKLKLSNNHVKISFLILVLVISMVLISTILDLNLKFKKNSNIHQFIESVSIKQNLIKLHSDDVSGKKNDFVAKNRYYSEILVNISHFIVFVPLLGGSIINRRIFDWIDLSEKPYLQWVFTDNYYPGLIILASTTVSLKMFSFIKKKASGKEFALNALKRMINFWPILIILISFQICLPLFIQGPLVKELIEPMSKKCEQYWHLNLLFIHNAFIPLEQQCLPYTWTISSELQLYLIASLLSYIYIKNVKFGFILNLILIAIGFLNNVYISYAGLTTPNIVFFPFDYQSMRKSIFYSHSSTLVQLNTFFTIYLAFYLRLSKRSLKMSIEKEMLITMILMFYFISTFHSSLIFNVFNFKPNPILNTIYYIYNRSSFTLFVSWLILQNYPNGEPSKKEEVKQWMRENLLRRIKSKKEEISKGNILDNFVDKLNKNIHSQDESKQSNNTNHLKTNDNTNKRKISSSESTSDLSDHLNEDSFVELINKNRLEDTNNNPNYNFYNRKLIDLPEDDEKVINETKENNKINKCDHIKKDNNYPNKSYNRIKEYKKSNILVWIRLDKSIYYSHFFYLIYSLFNVNNAQDSDLISMTISVHSKIFWAYILAYLFHLLIEGPISNLTNKLLKKLDHIKND